MFCDVSLRELGSFDSGWHLVATSAQLGVTSVLLAGKAARRAEDHLISSKLSKSRLMSGIIIYADGIQSQKPRTIVPDKSPLKSMLQKNEIAGI